MNAKTDLIVIGGGVLGAFHAFHALKRGLTVRLFERNIRPQGASVRNFGQVVPSGMSPKWQAFGRRSLEIYHELHHKIDLTARAHGSIYLASDEEELQLISELAAINRQHGYPSQLLTKTECLSRYPGLQKSYCQGGLLFPEEITVEAREMIHRVLAYLKEQLGLKYLPQTLIQEVHKDNEGCRVVDQRGQQYAATKVIVCGGHEFQVLFPELFAASDLEVSKLQMMQTVPQANLRVLGNILTGLSIRRYESFRECPSYASIKAREDAQAYWKKWGVHILFKQSPDGSFIIGDSHEYADAVAVDELGFDILPEINTYMLAEAQKIFALEDWTLQKTWFGLYSQCKTRDIFQHTLEQDIHVVTGIGGKGMTASPGFAEHNLTTILGS